MSVDLQRGDCLELIKQIPDGSIDLVLTDPPYKTTTGGKKDGKNAKRPSGILRENNQMFDNQFNAPQISEWIKECYRVLKDGSHMYIFTNALNMMNMLVEANNANMKLHNILVWVKNNCTPSQFYMKNCEYILFLRKGKSKYINNIGESKTVHCFNNIIGNKVHPTEKPVKLLEFYISNSSNCGETVLDPFMGSGSTGVACVNTGRNFIGYELDEHYFAIAKQRISEANK